MSATNKTTNYSLPIFVGSDVPSWLVDWNNAMQLIDTAIGNVLTLANTNSADIALDEASIAELKSALEVATPIINETATKVSELIGSVSGISSTVESLKSGFTELQGDVGVVYKGILSAGETTLTIKVDTLTEESLIDVYTDVYGVSPVLVERDLIAKTVRLTFPLQTDILNIRVKVGE